MKQPKGLQKLIAKLTVPCRTSKLAAAVSGGCDSAAMLIILFHWSKINHIPLCVFHVDHSIRETSGRDASWVKALCEELGIEFYCRKASAEDMKSGAKFGSEGWARHFRYSSFADMMEESGAELVATGHNADDQIETVLMRLMRGSSWQGLCGIKSLKNIKIGHKKIRIWRPILNIHRSELDAFMRNAGRSWCTDETNETDLYMRNKIRHQLIPAMESIQAEAGSHIAELGSDALSIQKYLSKKAKKYIAENKVTINGIEVLKISKKPAAVLRREIIRLWLSQNGLEHSLSRALIQRTDNLWSCEEGGKSVSHRVFEIKKHKHRLWLNVYK